MFKARKILTTLIFVLLLTTSLATALEFEEWLQTARLEDYKFMQIGPGSMYKQIDIPEIPMSVNIIQIDLNNKYLDIDLQKPENKLFGGEKINNLVNTEIKKGKCVVAAINASFYAKKHRPVGLYIDESTMFNHHWKRASFIKTTKGDYLIAGAKIEIKFSHKKNSIVIDNVNAFTDEDKTAVYTYPYGDENIIPAEDQNLYLINIGRKKFTPTNRIKGKIHDILKDGKGFAYNLDEKNTLDPSKQNIVTVLVKNNAADWFDELDKGDKVIFDIVNSTFKDDIELAVTGIPQIVKDGKNVAYENDLKDSFAKSRHPRTGVGFDEKQDIMYWIVIDGRQPNFSKGVNLNEFAELFLKLDCYQALNLDGGGSSTMVAGYQVMNSPSDYYSPRTVSDGIFLLSNAKPGKPQLHLGMNYNNNYPAGSKAKLYSQVFDKKNSPLYYPDNTQYKTYIECDKKLGVINNNDEISFNYEPVSDDISYKLDLPKASGLTEIRVNVNDIDKLLVYPEEMNFTVDKKRRIYLSAFDENGNRLHLKDESIKIKSDNDEILSIDNNVIVIPKKEGSGILTIDTGKLKKVMKFEVKKKKE